MKSVQNTYRNKKTDKNNNLFVYPVMTHSLTLSVKAKISIDLAFSLMTKSSGSFWLLDWKATERESCFGGGANGDRE